MSNFDNIIQEINTNLPDNNAQSITAEKLRTTLVDLTTEIDTVQSNFEDAVEAEIAEFDTNFATDQALNTVSIINDVTSGGENNVLSAEQGKILNESKQDAVVKEYEETTINYSSYTEAYIDESTIRATTGFCTAFYPVEAGKTYKIQGKYGAGSSSYLYAFMNGDTFIASYLKVTDETKSTVQSTTVTVPTGQNITHIAIEWGGKSVPQADQWCKELSVIGEFTIHDLKDDIDDINNNMTALDAHMDEIDNSLYQHLSISQTWTTGSALESATVGQAPAFVSNSDYATVTISGLKSGDIVLAHCRAGSSNAKKYGAKVKNGVIVELVDLYTAVTDHNHSWTVDDSFDTIILNDYKSYVSFANVTASIERDVFAVDELNDRCDSLSDDITELSGSVDQEVDNIYDAIDEVADELVESVTTTWQWTTGSALDSATVGQAPAFVSSTDYATVTISGLTAGDVVNAHCRAGSSAAKKNGAKVKNGVIVELVDLYTQVTDHNHTWTVDDSFDTIILNDYKAYVSFATMSAETVKTVSKFDEIDVQLESMQEEISGMADGGEYNILCLGNSFTQDTVFYLPWLLREAEPNKKFNIYFTYMGGMPISQCLAYVTKGEVIALDGSGNYDTKYVNYGSYDKIYSWNSGTISWTETSDHKAYTLYMCPWNANAWVTQTEGTGTDIDTVLNIIGADKKWDIITIQQGGGVNYRNWNYYFKPYVSKLWLSLKNRVGYEFKTGYLMTHASYSNDVETLASHYEGLVANAQKIQSDTVTEVISPYGTAIQNARTTYLKRFGNNFVDGAKLKNGYVVELIKCDSNHSIDITCDGTYDEIILNNDSSVVSTPVTYFNEIAQTWTEGTVYNLYPGCKPSTRTLASGSSIRLSNLHATNWIVSTNDTGDAGICLLSDTAHLINGIGDLIGAYTNAMTILDLIGSRKTIFGSQIVPDADWASDKNIIQTTDIQGLTPYNIWLAQQCAIMAIKNPFAITDLVAKGMCNENEIEITDDKVISSNVIMSANTGDSWTSTLSVPSGYTMSNVKVFMDATDITSTAYDSSTHVVTIDNVTSHVTIEVTVS